MRVRRRQKVSENSPIASLQEGKAGFSTERSRSKPVRLNKLQGSATANGWARNSLFSRKQLRRKSLRCTQLDLERSTAVLRLVKDADRVELGIRLPRQPLDVFLVVSAVIVATIRNNKQSAFAVVRGTHLTHAQVKRFRQCGLTRTHLVRKPST